MRRSQTKKSRKIFAPEETRGGKATRLKLLMISEWTKGQPQKNQRERPLIQLVLRVEF